VAWLGISEGEVFIQPAPGSAVLCNRVRLSASHWLRDGDTLLFEATQVNVRLRADTVHLLIEPLTDSNPTEPPVVLVPPPRDQRLGDLNAPGPVIKPIGYTPRAARPTPAQPRGAGVRTLWLTGLLALSAVVALLLSRVATVGIAITPEPETVSLRGAWPTLRIGSRFLAFPGRYVFSASKSGYRPLETTVDVSDESEQTLTQAMRLLPGRLAVDTGRVSGAEVALDGALMGATPLKAFEVESGVHEVTVRAAGYEEFRAKVAIEGRGIEQRLTAVFVPLPPPRPVPATPPPPPALAMLVLRSEPVGARVSVDGADRGEAPVDLPLEPGKPHVVRVAKAGHDDAEVRIELRAGQRREETVRLAPQLGEVRFAARPPDAELLVDGESKGRADQVLQLLAVPHAIEIRREGYGTIRRTVTPRPGFPQTVSVALESLQQAQEQKAPRVFRSKEGHEMRLVEGSRIKMGASRREPGRRANEPLRDVELVRRFYVTTLEVSNAQFRRFDAGHSSGRVGSHSLDLDDQPVVRVSWQQAAAYCNWLSGLEGLPKAYVEREGRLVAAVPLGTGYRLLTEAEWERAARYPGGGAALKYPWGPALPVPPQAGNFADTKALGLVAQVIDGYDDGFPVTAPVRSFAANALGLWNLGGNAAEWAHDFYAITPSVEGQLVRDPLGPAEGEYHVIRGASWMHATVTELRLSYRDYGKEPRPDVGFRVARYAESLEEVGS
jgi:formylglycine-generating enzyme required for sulfatase activity